MQGNLQYMPTSQLVELDKNPRYIKEDDFAKLCTSLTENPEYFEARPIIISNRTGQNVIIAGNQRYKAAKHIGLKKVPVFLLPNLTEEKERELVIRDNVSNGQWDFDMLANEGWDVDQLNEWGLNLPFFDNDEPLDSFFAEKEGGASPGAGKPNQIVLEYSSSEFAAVNAGLAKISDTPEAAVWKLLKEKGLVE